MKKKVLSLVALALVLSLTVIGLSGCGEKTTTITVFNCFDYIDEKVLEMFTQETGIKVTYTNYTSNEEMYAKMENGSGTYDVIFPSDYMVERLIREDKLAKLDLNAMPNLANLIEWTRHPDCDPNGEYSAAYMWGTVGILYNPELTGEEITSWGSLFDPKYQHGVFMLDSYRDSFCVALKYLGFSVNSHDEAEMEQVKELLMQQKQDGIVAGYFTDETKDKMIAGEAAMAVMYSGDALYAIDGNENLVYVVPEEGSNVWIDCMCIPKASKHKEAAQKFIDFMCRPDIAELNQEYIYYSSPVQAVVDGYTEEEKEDEGLNPSQEVLDRCEFFHDTSEYMSLYDSIWIQIRA